MSASGEFVDLLVEELEAQGERLAASLDDARLIASEELAALALAVGEPGYQRAVIASRDNVILRLGLKAVAEARDTDQRMIGIIQGALFFGAQVIAGGPR